MGGLAALPAARAGARLGGRVDPDLRIREWRPGEDDEPLRKLANEVYGLDRSPAFFRWKYRANPAGEAHIALAELAGRPVCMACVMPLRMRVGGAGLLGSVSVDIATRAEFRGQGLYREVAGFLWERLDAAGIALTYGFTNRDSTGVTLGALGRQRVGPLPLRVRPLRPLRLALGALGRGVAPDPGPDAAGGRVRCIDRFDPRYDRLWSRLEPRVDIAAVRDARFLNWRYAERPGALYEILEESTDDGGLAGYLVWRPMLRFRVRTAFVADVSEDPERPGAARRLLRAAARRARGRGSALLALLSWGGSPVHRACVGAAPLPVPPVLFPQMNVFSAISHRPGLATHDLARPGRWWLGWGDSDVV